MNKKCIFLKLSFDPGQVMTCKNETKGVLIDQQYVFYLKMFTIEMTKDVTRLFDNICKIFLRQMMISILVLASDNLRDVFLD
jgi:hypothetical protein